jgi:hypothetical protein
MFCLCFPEDGHKKWPKQTGATLFIVQEAYALTGRICHNGSSLHGNESLYTLTLCSSHNEKVHFNVDTKQQEILYF